MKAAVLMSNEDQRKVLPELYTPEQLGALMKADLANWAKVIKAANIKLDSY